MARLELVDPANAKPESKALFEGPLKGKELNIFKAMANSPAVLNTYLGMAGALEKASLSAKEREAVQLVTGQSNNCDYCVAAHTVIGKGAGLTDEQTKQARRAEATGDARIDAVVAFAKAIHEKKGFVEDADIDTFRNAGFDDGAVAEVVAAYALATFTNYFNHVAATPIDFPNPDA